MDDAADRTSTDGQTGEAAALPELVESTFRADEPTGPEEPRDDVGFVVTKEHRRFTELADAVRRDRYIGLCYGPPGVGKTLSARRYASWHEVEPLLRAPVRHYSGGSDRADRRTYETPHAITPFVELLIVDEADRLKTPVLDQLRDHYDRSRLGMILIGMPGIEKTPRPLSPALQQDRLRPRVPPAGHHRADLRPAAPLDRAPKISPQSPASPAATSASSSGCSPRHAGSWRSTS